MHEAFRDLRTWCLAGALLLTASTLVLPRINMARNAFDIVAVVDITGSMLTRDMENNTAPKSRLDATKKALLKLLSDLPCQSRLGLGVFTERRSFLLFNPVDVCADFAPIERAIADLDWRMGWEGDSFVAKGFHSAIDIAKSLNADLVFLTDGHEAPPLPPGSSPPAFEGKIGDVKGIIAGLGGKDKVPIPKFDDAGRETGVYSPQDVVQENHSGPPPADAEKRPGYHPKWAPFGTAAVEGEEHLSSVRADHLSQLAAQTGLRYHELALDPNLFGTIADEAHPRVVIVPVDIRPYAAGAALAALAAIYAAPFFARLRSFMSTTKAGQTP